MAHDRDFAGAMSQAFTKEGDASDDLPERPVSERPNYVTPAGLAALRLKARELAQRRAALLARRGPETEAELRLVERDLRYFEARSDSALLVDRAGEKPREVLFGAMVEVEGPEGPRRFAIVGEDEADPAQDKLAWSSPLALALIGALPGAEVSWGTGKLKVVSAVY